jgi:hypothetical protein
MIVNLLTPCSEHFSVSQGNSSVTLHVFSPFFSVFPLTDFTPFSENPCTFGDKTFFSSLFIAWRIASQLNGAEVFKIPTAYSRRTGQTICILQHLSRITRTRPNNRAY